MMCVKYKINVTVGYTTVGDAIDGDSCMPAVCSCIFEQVMSPFVLIPPTILFIVLLCNIVFNDTPPYKFVHRFALQYSFVIPRSPYNIVHSDALQY